MEYLKTLRNRHGWIQYSLHCPPDTILYLYISFVSLFILSHVSHPHTPTLEHTNSSRLDPNRHYPSVWLWQGLTTGLWSTHIHNLQGGGGGRAEGGTESFFLKRHRKQEWMCQEVRGNSKPRLSGKRSSRRHVTWSLGVTCKQMTARSMSYMAPKKILVIKWKQNYQCKPYENIS